MNNTQYTPNFTQSIDDPTTDCMAAEPDEAINDSGTCFNRIAKEVEAKADAGTVSSELKKPQDKLISRRTLKEAEAEAEAEAETVFSKSKKPQNSLSPGRLALDSVLDAIGREDAEVISQGTDGSKVKRTKSKEAPSSLCIHADDRVQQISFGEYLGNGYYKRAYKLGNGKAILLPNVFKSRDFIQRHWGGMVRQEVEASDKLRDLGLLTSNPKNVGVSLNGNEATIPAYICDDFNELKDTLVLDNKNSGYTSKVHDFLQERHININPNNTSDLLNMIDPLIKDVATLFRNNISVSSDSINLALSSENQNLHFRCFCFDLSGSDGKSNDIQLEDKLPLNHYKSFLAFLMDKVIETLDADISEEQRTTLHWSAIKQLRVYALPELHQI